MIILVTTIFFLNSRKLMPTNIMILSTDRQLQLFNMDLVTGQILTTPTTTTPSTTIQTHPPTTSTTSTTTTTTLPTTTTTSATTTPPTTSEVPSVLNLTYLEQVKVALTVDPKETSGTCIVFMWYFGFIIVL